ncbi:UNVERIFIED_CONTAM: hypothetical protein FKN15_014110 [Acipenser sinensis]
MQAEISLNSRNPAAIIRVVPERSVQRGWRLPSLTFSFLTRAALASCPDGTVCDFIGLVRFVGRPERTSKKGGGGEEFSVYRWLQLDDGTGAGPILLKLHSTSQPETHARLRPSKCPTWGSLYRSVSSSKHSKVQLSTAMWAALSSCPDGTICDFIGLVRFVGRPERTRKKGGGGEEFSVYRWLQLDDGTGAGPILLKLHSTSQPETHARLRPRNPCLLSMEELRAEVGRLQYREHRRFTVQGSIIAARYCRPGERQGEQGRLSTSRAGLSAPLVITLLLPPSSRRLSNPTAAQSALQKSRSLLTTSGSEDLIATAPALANKHFLFVLDISQQGAERLEVVLNRAYPYP